MKNLYQITRHHVWLTQFGLSVALPPVLFLLGAVFGWILAVGNFLSLSITVSNALDRAANGGSPQKAQLEIQTSSVVRPLVLALIYIVLFRAKVCDPVAALLPLLFAQVAIKVLEFFRNDKKGGDTAP